mmetsp:Transcript_16929/g.43312  ORF Transcript_16929/g.43312 Transcript_16929/m.43312 type:complete len:226 (+) Transcript_16929:1260-1937(+)
MQAIQHLIPGSSPVVVHSSPAPHATIRRRAAAEAGLVALPCAGCSRNAARPGGSKACGEHAYGSSAAGRVSGAAAIAAASALRCWPNEIPEGRSASLGGSSMRPCHARTSPAGCPAEEVPTRSACGAARSGGDAESERSQLAAPSPTITMTLAECASGAACATLTSSPERSLRKSPPSAGGETALPSARTYTPAVIMAKTPASVCSGRVHAASSPLAGCLAATSW